ncbi:O-antigen ligase family protein [Vibrio paucivorans]
MNQTIPLSRAVLALILLGCLFFSFNTVFTRADALAMYDTKRMFVCAIVILFCLALVFSSASRHQFWQTLTSLNTTTQLLLFTLFAFSFLANWRGLYFWPAHANYFYIVGLALTCICLVPMAAQNRVMSYQYFIAMSVLLFLSIAGGQWLRTYYQFPESIHSVLSFINPRFINQVQIWILIPLMYLTLLAKRKQRHYRILQFISALNVAGIIATDARGIAIAGISAVLIWAWLESNWRRQVMVLLIQSLIFGYILKLLLITPIPAYILHGGELDWSSIRLDSPGRIQLWLEALALSSFWGLGGDAFVCLSERFGRPHNSALLVWVNWGFIPLVCYLALLLQCLITVWKTPHRLTRVTGLSLLAGFAYSLVSGVLDSPLSQLMAILSIALFWASFKSPSGIPHDTRIYHHVSVMVLALASSVFIIEKIHHRVISYPYLEQSRELKVQFWLGYNCQTEPVILPRTPK